MPAVPRTREILAEGLEVRGHPYLCCKFKASVGYVVLCLKRTRKKDREMNRERKKKEKEKEKEKKKKEVRKQAS